MRALALTKASSLHVLRAIALLFVVSGFFSYREMLLPRQSGSLETHPIQNLGAVHSQRAIVVEHQPVEA
ncbi:MAG: hypothetical protein QOF74_2618 [Caballeronia mineralivorans]|jgi:hypothetical protein|nr:hypothetical protein [Caballeronia mineralivorans]